MTEFVPSEAEAQRLARIWKKALSFCSEECLKAHKIEMAKNISRGRLQKQGAIRLARDLEAMKIPRICSYCGKDFIPTEKEFYRLKKRGPNALPYCTELCKKAYVSENSRRTAIRTNAWYGPFNSERMLRNNPTKNPVTRAKISKKLRDVGHRPHTLGGNGRELPVPQKMLLDALGEGWVAELPIRTCVNYANNPLRLPSNYKVDIANLQLLIAVEVDGYTHYGIVAAEQDKKKDACLIGLGWIVLRFSNKIVLKELDACVEKVLMYTT